MIDLTRIEQQNREFNTLDKLIIAWNRLKQTAVVEDDYPEMRHYYEAAIKDFLIACKENGR